jgi:hypothetical protein
MISTTQNPAVLYRVNERQSRMQPLVAGRYVAAPNPLGGAAEIRETVSTLRALLNTSGDEPGSVQRVDLLEAWMSVERSLGDDEHRELSAAVFSRLFPEGAAPALSDGTATLGGY